MWIKFKPNWQFNYYIQIKISILKVDLNIIKYYFSQLSADLESAFHNKDFADVKVANFLKFIVKLYRQFFGHK